MSYNKFLSFINKSNRLFNNQLNVAKRMIEVYGGTKDFIECEIDNKLRTLQTFVDKMNDLIDEIVIHLNSNKQDTGDINNLLEIWMI